MQLLNVWQLPWMAYSICHRRSELQLLGAVLAYCPPKPGLLLVTRRLRLFKIFFFQKLLLNAPFVASLILCFGGKVCLLQVWSTHGHKQHRPRLQALHLLYKLSVLPRDHPLVRPKQSVELCARSLSSEMPNFSRRESRQRTDLIKSSFVSAHVLFHIQHTLLGHAPAAALKALTAVLHNSHYVVLSCALLGSMSAQLLFSRLAVIWSADQLLPAGARALSTSAACWQAAKRQSAPSSAAASQEALVAQLKQQSLLSPRAAE